MNDSLQKLRVSVSSFEKEEQADMLDKLKAIEQQLLHSKILHSDMEEQKDCKSVRGIIKHQVAKLRYMWYVIGCRMPLNDLIRVLFGSCLPGLYPKNGDLEGERAYKCGQRRDKKKKRRDKNNCKEINMKHLLPSWPRRFDNFVKDGKLLFRRRMFLLII